MSYATFSGDAQGIAVFIDIFNVFLQIFRLLRALALSDLCVMVTGTLLHGLPGISSKYLNVIQPMIAPYLLPLAQVGLDLCYPPVDLYLIFPN